ncbi:MAG: CysS/YqeB C-terminal domain-containing protein [Actinopolymorphaceae bacterium]
MKARARALDRKDAGDATQLRDELAKLGVVVRDEEKRQFLRTTGSAGELPAAATGNRPSSTRGCCLLPVPLPATAP